MQNVADKPVLRPYRADTLSVICFFDAKFCKDDKISRVAQKQLKILIERNFYKKLFKFFNLLKTL